MYYAIDHNLLSQLKAIAALDPNNADLLEALSAAEADPLVSSLMWSKADAVAAARKLIQGDNAQNPDGSGFKCDVRFADSARERLAQELAGDPDELVLGVRDEIDGAIELKLIDLVRDEVEAELGEIGADHQGYDGLPDDYVILDTLSRLPEEVMAGGLNACARVIAEKVVSTSDPVRS